jgi:hypothetical protein
MANMLGAIALLLAAAFVGYAFLGLTGTIPWLTMLPYGLAVLFGAAVLALAKYGNLKFASGLPLSKQSSAVLGVILLFVVAYYGGWLSGIMPSASVTSPYTPAGSITGQTASGCAAAVNPQILGKAATLTINPYDLESNTPYSAPVGAGYLAFKNGAFLAEKANTATITNLAVGDVVDIYGKSNSSYYVEDATGTCINAEQDTIQLNAHAAAADTSMRLICYASDGTVLNAASNSSQGDYNLTQGAGAVDVVKCIIKTNAANKAYWLKGIATGKNGNGTKDITVVSPGWTQVPTPTFLTSGAFTVNKACATVGTGNMSMPYMHTYSVSSPVKLSQWAESTIMLQASADASTDPTFVGRVDATSIIGMGSHYFVLVLDQGTGRDAASGSIYNDIATHDVVQSGLGLWENATTFAGGKTTGVNIEVL